MNRGHFCFDIEGNGLLDNSTVDYTASPFKIKPHYNLHCIVATNMDTNESFEWVGKSIYTDFRLWVKENVNKIVGHNIINFDLLALTACLGMDYTLGFEGTSSTWDGKPVEIVDTFILSKTLWPDRPGHSLDYLGSLIGEPKIDWRAKAVELGLLDFHAPKGAEFATYHPEMLVYNRQDVKANIKVYDYLMKEWGSWKWENAFELEQYVAWVITRQQHRGFHYNKELASECVEELDLFMKERRERVEPHLPEKVMGKTKIKEFTPPKTQFLKSGKPSSHIEKWVEKHGGSIVEGSEGYVATVYGKDYLLPITTPVKTHEPASISDSTFIKEVLVGMGWKPSNFKEKDLTLDSKKKKLTKEKYEQTVDRYVEQTLNSNFKKFRLERLGVSESTFKSKLLAHDLKKPLKVLTNPTFTVGQEKEIDPALEEMESTFPYAKDIVEYLTFNHRRNSILGGGFDLEDEEDASTGFLPNVREDGRIPTPADSCGASTGRMKHRLVCNIPRVTSLYGEKIREQFGVGDGKEYVQFAFDFCSLEAMIESHYCWRYDNTQTKEYCNSLIQEKPNDVHTRTAAKISEMIDQAFGRGNSKAVKYCCSYGGQGPKVAQTVGCTPALGQKIFEAFWEAASPLARLKEALIKYWETVGEKKFILGLDGRKIMTRSKHSLVNSLFQSAGVICAKRSMVYQDISFRENGYAVNFWLDDWRNSVYIQQLIAYHDEAQMEVKHGLFTYKKFENEEICKDWIKQQEEEWLVLHTNKGWFAASSPVIKICRESVEKTSKFYKLNVNLAIDPQLGLNWANCH